MLPPLAGEDFSCSSCELSYPELTIAAARALIGEVPDRANAALAGSRDSALRTRPAGGGWSSLEYACHLRDVYITYTIRLYRTRTEERPVLEPMLNDLRAERFGYNQADPAAVLGELPAVVRGCLAEIERVRDWDRTATRLPGEARTARWLVRQTAHEGVHHLRDIKAALGNQPSS